MASPAANDPAKTEAFVMKALGDLSGTLVTHLCYLGDRLDLFKDLDKHGPATSGELAARTGLQERYLREWASGLASAGYLSYDPSSRRFALPPEHAPVLAQELGPVFFGGAYHFLPALLGPIDRVAEAFRNGGGVPTGDFAESFWDGFERFSGGWFENLLLPVWLPSMPEVEAKLKAGGTVADVGCGRGRALIKLAQTYPNAKFYGFDGHPPTITRAKEHAKEVGVGDRIEFTVRDFAKDGLPDKYDVVTTFDVIHDMVDPRGGLRSIWQSLKADGVYVCLENNVQNTIEGNAGPVGAFTYGASVFYCMTSSLALGGEGLGTCGMPESKVRELGTEAGFTRIRRVPVENPFNNLYELRP